MASFTIQQEGQPTRTWRLPAGTAVLGRSDEVQLVLPDTSVSRRHAQVEAGASAVELLDLGSANGTTVNGKEVVRWTLADGDVIQVGTFTLTFREADSQPDIPETDGQMGHGNDEVTSPDLAREVEQPELTSELPVPPPITFDAPTLRLDNPVAGRTAAASRRESARLVAVEGSETWPVGDGVRFGKEGIAVRGLLPFGTPPTIQWNGTGHRVIRESMLVPVDVNGKSVRDAVLQPGDTIRVGTSRFRYEA